MSYQMRTTVNGQSDVIYNELKNKKAGDRTGWEAAWLKKGGDEMVKSLVSIFNGVEEERKIPKQGSETKIKSIYKGGQKENLSETQRKIFTT